MTLFTLFNQTFTQNLRRFGIGDAKLTDGIEIVVGDPTSIKLLNPMVSIIFIIDVWVSIEYVHRAIVRVYQTENISAFVIACFYLSGHYGLLMLCGSRSKINSNDCDEYIAGPITSIQCHSTIFIDIYYFLSHIFSKNENSNDVALAATLYTLTIGALPLIFGFFP
ncbi:hypothetical protein THRCLA_06396 [Thraustotheca clavata]|uniref:Uncharacterized protein n=1 Tax=Thraustotheca clavata TaxID=74557 RepID=A0A1V9ZP75_9STRA|nr:hypothetical protein THRCLA_06396 [Thraustotheca clavata]